MKASDAGAMIIVVGGIFGLTFWGLNIASEEPQSTLPACATEDSDNCRWDADTQGNGIGRSFVVVNGVVTYEDTLKE